MRFVGIKSAERQASAMVFRGRDLLVGQRTQIINAPRGHMAEHGWIAPKGRRTSPGLPTYSRMLMQYAPGFETRNSSYEPEMIDDTVAGQACSLPQEA